MSRIFWDTNLFIYLFEDYGPLSESVAQLRSKMLNRGDQLLTSTLTLGEILVKPTERRDGARCRKYEHTIATVATVVAFDVKAARFYAALRSERSLKAPDAIQLACAASVAVDLFVTNDERLQGRHVDGIQFIVPLARVPF
jgi:predicted nucleic acid-binding protein